MLYFYLCPQSLLDACRKCTTFNVCCLISILTMWPAFNLSDLTTLDVVCDLGRELWPPLWCFSPASASDAHLPLCPNLWGASLCIRQSHGWQGKTYYLLSACCLVMPWDMLVVIFLFMAKKCQQHLWEDPRQGDWSMSHNHESVSCDSFRLVRTASDLLPGSERIQTEQQLARR